MFTLSIRLGGHRAGGIILKVESWVEPAGGEVIRVVVVDDQTIVREGLVAILGLLPEVAVVGAAAGGQEAIALVEEHEPDVVLMDLRMPDCDGAEATGRIRSSRPGTEVVVLTTYEDDESILAALQAGARGYLTKDATRWQIAQAIHAAAGGQAILSPAIQDKLLAAATKPAQTPDSPPPRTRPATCGAPA